MSKTILLADDSVTIQKVIELTFMDQDWEVVSVSNGDDAIARIEEGVGGLVIADVHMPGASGFEVARRSKDRDPNVPVLLLVGTFEPFEEAEYEASGADAYLKKPFDSQELLELVEELASGAGPAAPAADSDLSDVELDLDEEPDGFELGEDEDETFGLTGGDLGEAEEETAGLGDGEAVWGNLDLEEAEVRVEPEELDLDETEEEPSPAFESTVEEEPAPFRVSEEPGESFALEAETVRMETVTKEAPEEPAEPEAAPPPPAAEATPAAPTPSGDGTGLSDEDVERIARRVADLIGETVLRDVAWEVIPDLAEVVIKDRIRELERQIE